MSNIQQHGGGSARSPPRKDQPRSVFKPKTSLDKTQLRKNLAVACISAALQASW
jgi:hypothetical protein